MRQEPPSSVDGLRLRILLRRRRALSRCIRIGPEAMHKPSHRPGSMRLCSCLHRAKERVLGVDVGGAHKAYPFAELSKTGGELRDRVGGREIIVRFDWANDSARAFDAAGHQLSTITGFWFAWFAFHPETEVFQAGRG